MRHVSKNILTMAVAAAFIGFAVTFAGCDNLTDFKEINTNPNNPGEVPSNPQIANMLTSFTYEVVANEPVRTPALWMQQIASNGGSNVDRYQYREVDPNNLWTSFLYGGSIKDARNIARAALDEQNFENRGIAQTVEAFSWMILADLFNDVPLEDTFQPDEIVQPTYDTQEEVYAYIFATLDSARVNLNKSNNAQTDNSGQDLLFGGNSDAWVSLTYALEARAHIHLTESGYGAGLDGTNTRQARAQAALNAAQQAFPGGLSQIPAFEFEASPLAENPWYQYTFDGKWVLSEQMSTSYISLLKDREDPRLAVQARQVGAVSGDGGVVGSFQPAPFDPNTDFSPSDGTYLGYVNGAEAGPQIVETSSIGTYYSEPDAPVVWINPAEMHFIEAEAEYILNGDAVNGAVEDAFEAGIESSMQQLQVVLEVQNVDEQFVNDFIADRTTDLNANGLEEIITEKYVANFLNLETFNDYRRTGFPNLTPVAGNVTGDVIPRRFPYPISEFQNNANNVPTDIGRGPDALQSPVGWMP